MRYRRRVKPTPLTPHDHIDGPENAQLTLIEYGDFSCPFCVRAFPILESVRQTYRGRIRFVFRHLSKSSQGFDKQAAEASEFAASEGRFWEMHRELFTHPDQHEPPQLVSYAAAIGLDAEKCRLALLEHRFAAQVRELAVAAVRSGIIGTPVLFLNDERFEDRIEIDTLTVAIDKALAPS
jgi:protein-disulfide isomerase